MIFIKTTNADLQKGITIVDENGHKRRVNSILDLSDEERMALLASAYSESPEMSELWARCCKESVTQQR
ncbi:MAG: hypothetical protein J6Y07_01795 [Alphaproteobacteria bacterium]|nr:hypothetical protein [Alphaproteobacteria bacterium]